MKEYKVICYDDGSYIWLNENNEVHRDNGPAVKQAHNKPKMYYNGSDIYREEDQRADGYKAWFKNGKLHREDGPATIYDDGYKAWFINGKRHREDGPAVLFPSGTKAWYLNGIKYSRKEYNKKLKPVKELTVKEIEDLLGYNIKIVK